MRTVDARRARRAFTSQRGVSLIETLVALGLFAVSAGTLGTFLVQQIRLAASNYLYTQAYAVAEQQLESTRALRYSDMAPSSKTTTVGGVAFNVATNIQTDVPADGLKQITVNVSWKDQQGTKNVAVQTIYTEVQRY